MRRGRTSSAGTADRSIAGRWIALLCLVALPAGAQLLQPSDLVYEGVVAPPQLSTSGPRFGYGMFGLAYDPTCAGGQDPSPNDGYPGCLAATSHKNFDMVAMFDIPAPQQVAVGSYGSVPKGFLVSDLFKCSIQSDGQDIQQLLDQQPNWRARDIPGITRSEAGDWLCTCGHDWYNVLQVDYPSHCWFDFDPLAPNAVGAWNWGPMGDGNYHSQRMAWYLGSVPQAWADLYLGAAGQPYCFSGMQREGGGCYVCSGGPTIYAFPCGQPTGSAPGPETTALELLGYNPVYPISAFGKVHPDFSARSQTRGATWVGNAVVVSASKGGDFWWYGREDPWTDPAAHRNTCNFGQGNPDDCFLDYGPDLPPGTKDNCLPGSHGFHALLDPDGSGGPQYTMSLQFYNASDLAQVAQGQRPPESVLPYNTLEAPAERWNANCAEPGDLAYDPVGQKLYWVEMNKEQPLIHVYTVNTPQCCNDLFELEVGKASWGSIASQPAGIDCGADCLEEFLEGTTVTLSATPLGGADFAGWGGDPACASGQPLMDAPKYCTASFTCPPGSELVTGDLTIVGQETYEHCNRLEVGPSVVVRTGAHATFRAGKTVVLGTADLVVEQGARMTISNDPLP